MNKRTSSETGRNIEAFVTRLGAHTAHIAGHTFRAVRHGIADIASPAAQRLSEAKVRRELDKKSKKNFLSVCRERFANRRSKLGTGRAVALLFRDIAGNARRNTPAIINTAFPVVCIGILVFTVCGRVNTEYAVEVEVDGDTLGIVTDENIYGQAKQEVTEKLSPAVTEAAGDYYSTARLSIRPVSSSDTFVDEHMLAGKLEEKLAGKFPHIGEVSETDPGSEETVLTAEEQEEEPAPGYEDSPGYVVFADRVAIGVVSATDEIEAFLAEKKEPYLRLKDVGEDDIFFDKDITFEERVYVPPYVLQEQQEVIDILSGRETEAEYYEVEAGDNLWAISSRLSMTVEELAKRPATFNGKSVELGNNIRVGTIIELESDAPFLSVEYRRLNDYEKDIPCETITIEDSSLMRGQEEVVNEGHDGVTKVSALVTYKVVTDEDGNTSGKPIRKRIVSEEPLISPSARVVHVGTAIPTATRGSDAGSGDYFWPVEGGYISDTFGSNRNHKGLDIAAPYGTPIYAAADGTVYDVGSGWCGGYGNNVKIQNDDGNVTVYAHMSMTAAENGQHVSAGDVIGYIGSTGDSTGNHLHFEVRREGSYYDPQEFISQ